MKIGRISTRILKTRKELCVSYLTTAELFEDNNESRISE